LVNIYHRVYPAAAGPQDQFAWGELRPVQDSMDETASMLLGVKEDPAGRVIGSTSLSRSNDPSVVRISSGLGLGFLFGVPLIRRADRALLRYGKRRLPPTGLDVPVISRVRPDEVGDAVRAV